jgi:hypothetical protein
MNQFESVVPILNVKNFAASMSYYVGKLGFTKKWDWGTPPTFGWLTRGGARFFSVRERKGSRGCGCRSSGTMWTRPVDNRGRLSPQSQDQQQHRDQGQRRRTRASVLHRVKINSNIRIKVKVDGRGRPSYTES